MQIFYEFQLGKGYRMRLMTEWRAPIIEHDAQKTKRTANQSSKKIAKPEVEWKLILCTKVSMSKKMAKRPLTSLHLSTSHCKRKVQNILFCI
jgi:hypothetical protein